jgi:antirestriction protein ArdC
MAAQIRHDLYAEVTSRILAKLERGAAPWVKPWAATPGQNVPQNAVTNRPYSGCNVILLWFTHGRGWPTPRFVTFKQAQEAGGSVRKGSTAPRFTSSSNCGSEKAKARQRPSVLCR